MSTNTGTSRATASMDWRGDRALFSSTPVDHQVSSFSPLVEPPMVGEVIRFPAVKVPETSVLWGEITKERLGSPWAHPALVIGVAHGVITCLQMTSKDVVKCSKSQKWADRYWPVSHDGKADHHSDSSERRKVWLSQGSQMEKLTQVNVERPVKCEWQHFTTFNAGTAKGPTVEDESLQRLLQSQPYAFRPAHIATHLAAPVADPMIEETSDSSLDNRSSPPPPAIFSAQPSPTSTTATLTGTSRSSSPLETKARPAPSAEKYVPPCRRQATTGTNPPASWRR